MDDEDEDDNLTGTRLVDLVDDQDRVRVNKKWCGTCIYWPENRMNLNSGVQEQMEADAIQRQVFIPCHQTLPYAQYDAPLAVCRGFFQAAGDRVWPLRYAVALGAVVEVDPPCSTWNKTERKEAGQ